MTEFEFVNELSSPVVHRSLAELVEGFSRLPPPPKDAGRLVTIVCRPASGQRRALERVHLAVETGVPGDQWNRTRSRRPETQLTVMRRDVSELIANGQSLTLSGDNLIVELDISAANLPVGTRLRVGAALVEMTPEPHDGCSKFAARFGKDAVRFVQAPATRHLNLRGVYWRVIEPGEAQVGSAIEVVSRPAATEQGSSTA